MIGGSSRLVAGCFALSAFLVAIVSGLAAHNPALTVLVRALIAMILCYPVGLLAGWLGARTVQWHREAESDGGATPPSTDAQSEEEMVSTAGAVAGGRPREEEGAVAA